jgi:tripartite-type tricarboxylate transporter receptor subunit TctC
MKTILAFASAVIMACVPLLGKASSFPDRPVKIVVPFAPGGPTDLLARALGKYLQADVGQPFLVENRAGAGGIVGSTYVAKAKPDGYTLLLVANGHAILPSTTANLPFDPQKDFMGIGTIGVAPYVLVARPELGVKTVDDLRASARKRDKPMFYGTPGSGTANHLAVQMLADNFGIPFEQVSFNGAAPATQALLGGQVDFIVNNLTSSMSFIKSGQLVAVGLTGKGAEKILPGVPLISASIPGYEALAWYGILAPAGTPAAIVKRLGDAMTQVSKNKEYMNAIVNLGVEPLLIVGRDFDEFIGVELKKWAVSAERAGLKPKQ